MTLGRQTLQQINEWFLKNDRSRYGIEDLYVAIRKFGIGETWQLKAVIKYLEAMDTLKPNGRLWIVQREKAV